MPSTQPSSPFSGLQPAVQHDAIRDQPLPTRASIRNSRENAKTAARHVREPKPHETPRHSKIIAAIFLGLVIVSVFVSGAYLVISGGV